LLLPSPLTPGERLGSTADDAAVEGIDKVLKSKHSFGNFYRPLAPGEYTLIFSSAGFSPEIANMTVLEDDSGIELEVYLSAN
jgi:hypothetical protein